MKLFYSKLIGIIFCVLICLPQITVSIKSLEKNNSYYKKNSRKSERINKKADPPVETQPTTNIDESWLKQKFDGYNAKFEEHKKNHVWIYSMIMLIVGFVSNLPDAFIEKFPYFKSALKLLKSFATLFANIRSITAECMNGFEELRNVFKQDQDSELNEKDIRCEIEKSSKKDNIKDYNLKAINERMHLTKSYYDPFNVTVKTGTEKAPTCNELKEFKKNGINPQSYPETNFSLQLNLGILFQDPRYYKEIKKVRYIATSNKPKSIDELKQMYIDEPDVFFANFDFQAEFKTQVLLDPENYPLSWKLVELKICPHRQKHFHLRALCFEAMLHRYNPTFLKKFKAKIDQAISEKAGKKPVIKEIVMTKSKNKKEYSDALGKSFSTLNNINKYQLAFISKHKTILFKIPPNNRFTKLKEEADAIRKEYTGKPNWQLLNDLPHHDVIAFKRFGKDNVKKGFFNIIWRGIAGLYEYTKSIIRFVTFRSEKEKLYPSEKDYEIPNTDIYTFGLSNEEIDTSDEIKKRLIEAYVIFFRVHNLVKSTAVSKVFDDFVNSDCKLFDNLPSFDLSEIDTEQTDVNKLVKEKKGIFKVVGEFFGKIWDIIKIIFKLYFDCVNPLYQQFSSIKEYSREFLNSELLKDIKKNFNPLVESIAKKGNDYESRVEQFIKAGFDKNAAKIMAFSTTLDIKFKELLKNPRIKLAYEEILSKSKIVQIKDITSKPTKSEVDERIETIKKERESLNVGDELSEAEYKEFLDSYDKDLENEKQNSEDSIREKIMELKQKEIFETIKMNSNEINESVSELQQTKEFKDKNLEPLAVTVDTPSTTDEQKTPVEQKKEPEKTDKPSGETEQLYQKDKTEPDTSHSPTSEVSSSTNTKEINKRHRDILDNMSDMDPDEAQTALLRMYDKRSEFDEDFQHCNQSAVVGAIAMKDTAIKMAETIVDESKTILLTSKTLTQEAYKVYKSDDSAGEKLMNLTMLSYKYGPTLMASSLNIAGTVSTAGRTLAFEGGKAFAVSMYDLSEDKILDAASSEESSATVRVFSKGLILGKIIQSNDLVKDAKEAKGLVKDYEKRKEYTDKSDKISGKFTNPKLKALFQVPTAANKAYLFHKELKLLEGVATKLSDDENTKRYNAIASFVEKSENRLTSSNRFKESLSRIMKVKKNNTNSTFKTKLDKEAIEQIENLHEEFRTNRGLKEGLTAIYTKSAEIYTKTLNLQQKYYEKLSKYYDIVEKISSTMKSFKENIFSTGFESIKTHITTFVKEKICAFLTGLAKQLLNVPVLSFLSTVWKLYKFFGIVRKIVNLLYSAIKSSMPDRMFYIGQFISELMNLGFAMFSEDTICKVAEGESSKRFKRLKAFKKRKN